MVIRITPWRDQQEWNFVKECLYSQGPSAGQDQARGISRIDAWSVRGRVPHAVISTALLTTALMRDQAGVLSMLEARMLLAMALTRFVNGLLDPAQQAVYAISMSSLARTLNLPEAFVEIRHAATHDALPSLPVLRGALRRGLDWLWHNYWNVQSQAHALQERQSYDNPELTSRLSAILKNWRKLRKDNPDRPLKTGDNDPMTRESLSLVKEFNAMQTSAINTQCLAKALLSPKVLGSSSSKSTETWQPLLVRLFQHFPALHERLVLDAISLLNETHDSQQSSNNANANGYGKNGISSEVKNQCTRLKTWVVWCLTSNAASTEDIKEFSRALSVAKDPYTMSIMESLKHTAGYEGMERLVNLRRGVNLAPGDAQDGAAYESVQATTSPQDAAQNTEGLKHWTLVKNSERLPIGFLIK